MSLPKWISKSIETLKEVGMGKASKQKVKETSQQDITDNGEILSKEYTSYLIKIFYFGWTLVTLVKILKMTKILQLKQTIMKSSRFLIMIPDEQTNG